MNKPAPFLEARPVWLAEGADSMNAGVGFLANILQERAEGRTILRLTATGKFRVFVNGGFVAHGPERAAHGYARVEEWDITEFLREGGNAVAVEVIAPRVNTYYTLEERGSFQAEVVRGGDVLCRTDAVGGSFRAFPLNHRVKNVQRYSFQRGFTEVFRMRPDSDAWRVGRSLPVALVLTAVSGAKLLPRRAPLPRFPVQQAALVRRHNLIPFQPEQYWTDRAIDNSDPLVHSFPNSEINDIPLREWQGFSLSPAGESDGPLLALEAVTHDLGGNFSGFIGLHVSCPDATRLLVVFDELETDGRIDPTRNQTLNIVCWNLEAGDYELETFEPYTLRFLQTAVMTGSADISAVFLRRYEAPIDAEMPAGSDPSLRVLFDAAVNTLRPNAADLLMDCPSRERAGWLADSYFSGRAAHFLTGTTDYESAFLENYMLAPDPFPNLPPGMVPMCYPAEHLDGNFIPQWALWLVCELLEFRQRGGDAVILAAFKPKIAKLFTWFAGYENELGLLERLPGWQFVEWSKANDLVHDVNFPTNWLYAAALDAASALYGSPDYARKAEQVRATATRLSWNGTFFVDRAVREENTLTPALDCTEACQYYAFYFGAATPLSHPELWQILREEFGPLRSPGGRYETVALANMLYGFAMRFDLLARNGARPQMLAEAKALLMPMVARTGTLWEHTDTRASCCHGFTAFIASLL